MLPASWQQLTATGVALLVVVAGCLVPFMAWIARRITITTRRIVIRHGLFVRVREEILHGRGYEVVVRRTWGQRIFGSGDVHIDTGHDEPGVVLRDVPRPELVQAALNELVARERARFDDRRRAEPTFADGDTVRWGAR